MKHLTKILFLLLIAFNSIYAYDDVSPELINKVIKSAYNSNSQGYEFYIAIPPNEVSNYGFEEILEIYVSSAQPCDVVIEEGPSRVFLAKKRISQPFSVITIGSDIIPFTKYEVRVADKPVNRVLRITSTKPISVYMINSKNTTTDGLMAIPTSGWGTEYYHCCYYDNNEGGSVDPGTGYNWFGSGFIMIAKEDSTHITVKLNGKGRSFASTSGGANIGDVINIILNEGQCYMIKGDGKTDGAFDLSGSHISSDKPIGLVSFHERADIPAFLNSSRDHLCEMIPPVKTWGTKYYSVEFDRNNKGDLFRLMASEDNTNYKVTWYDKETNKLIAKREGILKNAGDFAEIIEILSAPGPTISSVRGMSIFEADKPILVMQYAYSSSWDGFSNFDPFMIVVTPYEQFGKKTIFQTPSNKAFTDNKFNLIAEGDSLNSERSDSLLKSIYLDGVAIWKKDPEFLKNRIPNSNLYWMKTKVETGSHYVIGDTKFCGYVYGFTSVDSYGWPAAMSFNKIDEIDSLPPVVSITEANGEYEVTFTEKRNGEDGDGPKQIDLGVSEEPSLLTGSFNFDEPYFVGGYYPWPPNYDKKIILRVTDKTKDAVAYIQIMDRAENVTVREIKYSGTKLALNPNKIDFGDQKIFTRDTLEAKIKNIGTDNIELSSLNLKKLQYYSIVDGKLNSFKILKPGEEHSFKIEYYPTKEVENSNSADIDTLIVFSGQIGIPYVIRGRGVAPRINVVDWNADTVVVNSEKCNKTGLKITNSGTMPLIVTGIDFILDKSDFKIENPEPGFPFKVDPQKSLYFKGICFEPKSSGNHDTKIVVHNNGFGPDSIANLIGYANDFNSISEDIKADLISSITPNPASGSEIAIKFRVIDEQSSTRIMIVNSIGQIVKEINMQQMSVGDHQMNISLDGLATGAYNVKILNGQFMQTEKLIIK